MSSDPKILEIPAPWQGIDLVSAPDSIAKTRAPWMEGFLVGVPGRLPVMGRSRGIVVDGNVTWRDRDPVTFVQDSVTKTRWITRASSGLRPDQIPWRTAATNASLDQGRTATADGSTTLKQSGSDRTFYSTGANVSGTLWGFEYHSASLQSTTDLGYSGPRQWVRNLISLRNDAAVVYPSSAAPSCGIDVEIHLNRLFVLGGYGPAATLTPWSSSCLFFMTPDLTAEGLIPTTDQSGAAYVTGGQWFATNAAVGPTNLINRINIPGSDAGKRVVRLDQNLVILKENSIHVLYGNSPDTFTLRQVVDGIGCRDRDSVVVADGGIYFRSARGIEFFDGYQVKSASELIAPIFEDSSLLDWDSFRTTAGFVGQSYIAFQLEHRYFTSSSVTLLYHRPSGNWTAMTIGLEFSTRSQFLRGAPEYVERRNTWDSLGMDANSQAVIEGDAVPLDNARLSFAKVVYRRSLLGGFTNRARILRAFLQTKAFISDLAPLGNVWKWQATTSNRAAPTFDPQALWLWEKNISCEAVPDMTSPTSTSLTSGYWSGRLTEVDVDQEVDDVFFVVTYDDSATSQAPMRAMLYDGAIEYQETHNRRTVRPRSVPS